MKKSIKDIGEQIKGLYFNPSLRFVSQIVADYTPQIENSFQIVKSFIEATPLSARKPEYLNCEIGKLLKEFDEIDGMILERIQTDSNSHSCDSAFKIYSKNDSFCKDNSLLSLYAVFKKAMKAFPLSCSRTIFLTSNSFKNLLLTDILNDEQFLDNYALTVTSDENFIDEYKITAYYFKVVQLYFKLIEKLEAGLSYGSLINFKTLLKQKLQEVDSKLNSKLAQGALKPCHAEVKINVIDSHGHSQTITELLEKLGLTAEEADKFNISQFVQDKYFLTIEIALEKISLASSLEDNYAMQVGDSFLFTSGKVVNLTQNVNYFDFFDSRSSFSEPIKKMKDLYATKILGNRKLDKNNQFKMKLVMKEKLKNIGIVFPEFQATISWFEKGLKILNEKTGNFILPFEDVLSASFLKYQESPLLVLNLKNTKFFNKFAENVLIFECQGSAVTEFFYPLFDFFKEQEIECQYIASLPDNLAQNVKLFDLEQWISSRFNHQNSKQWILPKLPVSTIDDRLKRLIVLFYDENSSPSFSPDTSLSITSSLFSIRNFEYNWNRHHSWEIFSSEILQFISSQADSLATKTLVRIPLWAHCPSFWKALETSSLEIDSVISLIDYDFFANSNFADQSYKKFIFGLRPNLVVFSCQFASFESCDAFVYLMNVIYEEELTFTHQSHSKGNSLLQKIIESSNNNKHTGINLNDRVSICEKLFNDHPSHLYTSDQIHIKLRTPIIRSNLDQFYQKVFIENDGLLKIDDQSKNSNFIPIDLDLQNIEGFIKALKRQVKISNFFKEGKYVRIERIVGRVRLGDELDKVYQIELTNHKKEIKPVVSGIPLEDVEANGEHLKKPLYKGFDPEVLGLSLFVGGLRDRSETESRIIDALVNVF
jgi:hypothetical protein